MPTHEYRVDANWLGGRDGSGTLDAATSGEHFPIAVPTEFGGPGGATNPEELLTAAIAGCYSITFGIVAANRKLPITAFSVSATGEVDQQGASFTYARITLRPSVTLAADATDEQLKFAQDMAMKADHYCIITNAVRGKVEVTVEPTVTR